MLAAFAASWVGDACLLSKRSAMFVAGLLAFLLAHLAFAGAFALGPLDRPAMTAAMLVLVPAGALVMRWLWTHLGALFRLAVGGYAVAIAAMCVLAIASSAATGHWQVAAGAIGFAVSDLAVARDQFVSRGFVNKLWGLPLYYLSQLTLAWSIAASAPIA